jgi:hypothetical protein
MSSKFSQNGYVPSFEPNFGHKHVERSSRFNPLKKRLIIQPHSISFALLENYIYTLGMKDQHFVNILWCFCQRSTFHEYTLVHLPTINTQKQKGALRTYFCHVESVYNFSLTSGIVRS